MKPKAREDVLIALDGGFASAALGAAMELGLFWHLGDGPRAATDIAAEMGIPPQRCAYWLQFLAHMGYLDRAGGDYSLSAMARRTILEGYSRDTWAFLAREGRERLPAVHDLPQLLAEPGSAWKAQGLAPPSYLDQLQDDPGRARAFTRMLYEIHLPFAEGIAAAMDLNGVHRVLDLGGGSGVVSMALMRRGPELESVVVDLPEVCAAGREIAAEEDLADRITYRPVDFLREELPTGFDLAIECDVNSYGEDLVGKVRSSLRPGGRFVIVDQLSPEEGVAPAARVMWAFRGSLHDPDFTGPTLATVRAQLAAAGFEILREERLRFAMESSAPAPGEWTLLEARASANWLPS